jgi:hypothetical protein
VRNEPQGRVAVDNRLSARAQEAASGEHHPGLRAARNLSRWPPRDRCRRQRRPFTQSVGLLSDRCSGRVAEWFKAPVLKSVCSRPAASHPMLRATDLPEKPRSGHGPDPDLRYPVLWSWVAKRVAVWPTLDLRGLRMAEKSERLRAFGAAPRRSMRRLQRYCPRRRRGPGRNSFVAGPKSGGPVVVVRESQRKTGRPP